MYHSYLTKALLTMIVIYLLYVRDQLLKIFLNVDTVRVSVLRCFGGARNPLDCLDRLYAQPWTW